MREGSIQTKKRSSVEVLLEEREGLEVQLDEGTREIGSKIKSDRTMRERRSVHLHGEADVTPKGAGRRTGEREGCQG